MPDLRVGDKRPKSLIYGINPLTGYPAVAKDVYYGSTKIWTLEHPDIQLSWKKAGTYVYNLPDYRTRVDIVLVGGGGGGQAGNGGNTQDGKGGGAGGSVSDTITAFTADGEDVGLNGGSLTITVGAGGAGGTSSHAYGAAGGITKIRYATLEVTASGGASGGSSGGSSGSGGTIYTSFTNYHGHEHPVVEEKLGGGGAGGDGGIFNNYDHGQRGRDGYVFIQIRKVMPYEE